MIRLLYTTHLLLGVHMWSAQGDVDVFHTHICFEFVCLNRLLSTMYLFFVLAQGGVDVFHTHVCINFDLPGLAVVDHTPSQIL